MVPPLAVDIDGTLTHEDTSVDPRVFEPLRAWAAPVVVATGKSLPYPIGLCEFLGVPVNVVAENGGVAYVEADDELVFEGDRTAAQRVADAYVEAGHDLGWGAVDLVNRWRETEVAVSRDSPLGPLEDLAAAEGLEVVDTGYAYHVKSPDVTKGRGLVTAAERLGFSPGSFVAVGDSENDADAFERVGTGIAVANADETALASADLVTEASYSEGFLEALDCAREL